ncbi:MAG: TetR/AcrR family transcriptional regulator C-terminal domain-containing protein [Terracidiphilus sp.]
MLAKKKSARTVRRKRREGPAEPLKREQIVATALALVDRDGLKALSMRRLGAELGVDPMAVYYHLPNKQALLDAIVEAVMAGIDLSADHAADPPEERIMVAARAYRDAMLAHANALPILLVHGPATPAAMRPVELLIGILRGAGLGPARALAGMNAIAAAVRGVVGMLAPDGSQPPMKEETEAMAQIFTPGEFPYLQEAAQYVGEFSDHGFEFGIRALARGLLAEVRS